MDELVSPASQPKSKRKLTEIVMFMELICIIISFMIEVLKESLCM